MSRPKKRNGWVKLMQENPHYEDVLYAMSKKCKGLTGMESRVCTLVREGFTSAQIAEIFAIKEESVNFHRHNARKKLIKESLCLPDLRLDPCLRSLDLNLSQN